MKSPGQISSVLVTNNCTKPTELTVGNGGCAKENFQTYLGIPGSSSKHHFESFKFSYHVNTKYLRHYNNAMPDFYFNKHLARGRTVEECAEMCNDRRGRCVAFDWAPPLETGYHHHYDGGHQERLQKTKCIFHNSIFVHSITAIKLSSSL